MESGAPFVVVTRGDPTDEEIAALAAALAVLAVRRRAEPAAGARRTRWPAADTYRAPGSWR